MSQESTIPPLHALILDRDERQARVLAATLQLQGIASTVLTSLDSAARHFDRLGPGIVIVDLSLSDTGDPESIEALERLRLRRDEPLMVFTRPEQGDDRLDVWAQELGAVLVSPVKLSEVLSLIIEYKSARRRRIPGGRVRSPERVNRLEPDLPGS